MLQHYQRDADGLVCPLSQALEKKGGLDFSVDTEDFKKGICELAVIHSVWPKLVCAVLFSCRVNVL